MVPKPAMTGCLVRFVHHFATISLILHSSFYQVCGFAEQRGRGLQRASCRTAQVGKYIAIITIKVWVDYYRYENHPKNLQCICLYNRVLS